MKLIIEISEEDYKWLDYQSVSMPILNVIKNGIPLDDIRAEFTSLYPKNVYGGLELGGRSCVFSLNKVFEILDKHIDDECTADDCDECKNNYDCISYLEEHERMNSENEIGD